MESEFWHWFDNFAAPKLSVRAEAFRKIFEYLDRFEKPTIIETGCVGDLDDHSIWADNGCSTILFDRYIYFNSGQLLSVDINQDRVLKARKRVLGNTKIHCGDSIEFLSDYANNDTTSPNVVYLDSMDLDWGSATESQIHHFKELNAIFNKLTPDTLVVVDDSPFIQGETEIFIKGKGSLISQYANRISVPLYFSGYQSAWLGFPGNSNQKTQKIYTYITLIITLIDDEKYEEADKICDWLISQGEVEYDILGYKAILLAEFEKHEEAIQLFKEALIKNKNNSILRYYLSLSLFCIGRHREGWQALFQAALENENFGPLCTAIRRFAKDKKPLFVMQPKPATVHIHADAGYGDNFALMRYLSVLANKGYRVRYEARSTVVKLAQDSFPDVEVMPLAPDFPGTSGIEDFDYHLSIVHLPFVFQTEVDTIPWTGPYLKADPKLVDKYKDHKGKVGITWSTGTDTGSKRERYLRRKSIKFELLKPLIAIDQSRFVSTQQGNARLQNDCIVDCLPKDERVLTWADTAALIENLDLVITIDTSVAHLAGAMGKPVWLMMHKYMTSWQFMCETPGASWNTKSPWYPTMRIFRQKVRGDWTSVIDEIIVELGKSNVGIQTTPALHWGT